jgi:hypothetical protein
MKPKLLLTLCVFCILFTCCRNSIGFQKRQYRAGYYFHNGCIKETINEHEKKANQSFRFKKSSPVILDVRSIQQTGIVDTDTLKTVTNRSNEIKEIKKKDLKREICQNNKPGHNTSFFENKRETAKSRSISLGFLISSFHLMTFTPLSFGLQLYFPLLGPLTLALALIFFALAIVFNQRKKRLEKSGSENYQVSADQEFPKDKHRDRAASSKIMSRLFLLFAGFFILLGFLYTFMLLHALIFLLLALIFGLRRRRNERLYRKANNLPRLSEKQIKLRKKIKKIIGIVLLVLGILFSILFTLLFLAFGPLNK